MATRTTPFGAPATRLHAGRVVLVLALLVGLGFAGAAYVLRQGKTASKDVTESGTNPGWTASQMHYEKPEEKPPAPEVKPVDATAAKIAEILARLTQMDGRMLAMEGRIKALEERKPPPPPAQPKPPPVAKVAAPIIFVEHKISEGPPAPRKDEYVLAPGSKLPCIIETSINSDVEGYFTAKVSSNVYDSSTGRHLLVAQGSTILGRDHSSNLLYGNERLPTTSLTLSLPDGRSVELGQSPVTDQQGVAGLTGRVNQHYGRLFAAIFIGGALRGGVQALQTSIATAGGAGQIAAGYGSVAQQGLSPRIGRALDTRPTIEIDSGQLCNVLLIKPLTLMAMWE